MDIFCKIIKKEINAEIVDEDKNWLAFKDMHPQAPVHILIVPKKHIEGVELASEEDGQILGELILAVKRIAKKTGISGKGYRLIINQGDHGGQAVEHLHFHLLGGKKLGPKIIQEER